MGAAFAAGASWSPWLLALIVLGGLYCAVQPDTNVGLGVVVVIVWHWGVTVDDVRTPAVMLAALGIAVFHTAMAAASTAPPSAAWPRPVAVGWLRRTTVVAAVIVATWLVMLAITSIEMGGNAVLLLTALGIVTATALVLRARSLSGS